MTVNNSDVPKNNGLGPGATPLIPEVVPWEPVTPGYVLSSGAHDTTDEAERSPISYLGAIVARKWVVAAGIVLSLLASAGYLKIATPVFVSKATVEVEKLHPASPTAQELFLFFGQSQLHFQTQVEALRSGNVPEIYFRPTGATQESGDRLKLESGGEQSPQAVQTFPPPSGGGVRSFAGRIRVTPVEGTQLIRVEMTGSDPLMVKQDLQDYLDAFIAFNRARQTEITDRLKNWLRREMEEAEKQFEKAKQEYVDFAAIHGVITETETSDRSLAQHQRAAESFYSSKEARIQMEALRMERQRIVPSAVSGEYLQIAKNELAKLQAEYESMKPIYSPDYYKMGMLRTKIEQLQRSIEELEKSETAAAVEVLKKKEDIAGQAYEETRQEALKRAPVAVQLQLLKRSMDSARDLFVRIQEKYKQAEMEHVTRGPEITITSPPTLPDAPISPNKTMVFGVGTILGLLGGVFLAIILDISDRSVRNAREVERRLRTPVLGVVPRLSKSERPRKAQGDASTTEFIPFRLPISPFADAIRMVEHTITSHLPDEKGGVLCVSSAMPLEGKTFISVSMATAMATEQKRVLLVDGDLRRPRIHKLFRQDTSNEGLSDLLKDTDRELRSTIVRTRVPGLYFLSAGNIPENPVALLKTKRFREIIVACRKAFDYVIIDTPPMLGLADAAIMSELADGLVLVIHHGRTPLEALQRTYEIAIKGRCRVLGVVLNKAEARLGDYDYYKYRYYNRYYHKKPA